MKSGRFTSLLRDYRDDAFLISVQMTDLASLESHLKANVSYNPRHCLGSVRISDLRGGRYQFLSERAEWVHFYLPLAYLADLLSMTGREVEIDMIDPFGAASVELHALCCILAPILRDGKKANACFIENLAMAGARIIVDRYTAEGPSARSGISERLTVIPLPTRGLNAAMA
ncbi:hypothetical protein CWR43_32420 [Rhizobium sullae]|uniref:Uncharacterized protein n=2 Tax=Rhizobium sullae TaxID=50338 RepID=A0A2N0D036_RHISU|nr:hypothetical protein CWR43_32420 [Rhizobium sullae]